MMEGKLRKVVCSAWDFAVSVAGVFLLVFVVMSSIIVWDLALLFFSTSGNNVDAMMITVNWLYVFLAVSIVVLIVEFVIKTVKKLNKTQRD